MTAARRRAAILAVDVVGYSRLMGEDEAGTARAVREHYEAAQPTGHRLCARECRVSPYCRHSQPPVVKLSIPVGIKAMGRLRRVLRCFF
jgi:class 3 adenylate cyclase